MFKHSPAFYKKNHDDLVALVKHIAKKTPGQEPTPTPTIKAQRIIVEQNQEALRWQERDLMLQQEAIANRLEKIRVEQNMLSWQQEALREREEFEQQQEEEKQRQEEQERSE